MPAIDRWRKWRRSDEKSGESITTAPPQPPEPAFEGFEGSVLKKMPNFSHAPDPGASPQKAEPANILPQNTIELRNPFARWVDYTCVRHPRCFGGVSCLHIAFCEWRIRQGGDTCTRDTFEHLLDESGFLVGEVAGVALVSGLTFREDAEAAGLRLGPGGNSPSARK